MHSTFGTLLLGAALALDSPSIGSAQAPSKGAFWIAGELGYGSAALRSSLSSHDKGGFAMGIEGGYAFTPAFSVGLRLNGCTLEASNLYDPSRGESLSQFSVMLRVYPWPDRSFFLRGGIGSLRYTNNHPTEFDGSGTGFFMGAGYEFAFWKRLRIAPIVDYTWGSLGDVDNALATIHGRRCRLLSAGISLKFS